MNSARRATRLVVLATTMALGFALAGCGGGNGGSSSSTFITLGPEPAGQAPHSHKVDGDGTTATAGGYRLEDVSLPAKAGKPGTVSFRILDASGQPVSSFIADQTQNLHLYLVRDDLQDYRHLHPTEAADGTWSGRVNLPDPGQYRVITEFIPSTHTDLTPVVLGAEATVAGDWQKQAVPTAFSGNDGVVEIAAPSHVTTGFDQEVDFVVSDGNKGVVNLGTYLGSYAHLTAFDVHTGAFVHAHPLGEPTPGPDGSTLQFHISLDHADEYRLFVQVRVDGFLHTIALTLQVGKHTAAG